MSRDIGIDLGTSNVLVSIGGRGIALREPSVVAVRRDTGDILCMGEDARRLQGRAPANILVVKPLQDGVISQYELALKMLQYFLRKAIGTTILKPRIVICIPGDITEVEEKAVLDAATGAGSTRTFLIEEPVAAAIGAGIDITMPNGNLVVDIGGGTTDVAVISLGGVIASKSIKVAGDKFDEAIVRYIRNVHNVLIGERTAEELKRTIGTLTPDNPKYADKFMDVTGRCLARGLPKVIRVYPGDIKAALTDPVNQILDAITEVIDNTPPELDGDIVSNGILLTGGGCLLNGFDQVISSCIGVRARIPQNPDQCVAIGTGKAMRFLGDTTGGSSRRMR
ncbi:MAG: rod shape-determining protein [Eubacteriales bacterium]|nr:rod shape-determining protein [Eubacteriales bacterium]